MDSKFKVWDSVVVKPGTQDPDLGGDIGGWQGRIIAIEENEPGEALTVQIEWDSLTLRSIPEAAIIHCEREGLDWGVMGLYEHEVAPAEVRDTKLGTARAKEEISERYHWIAVGQDEAQGLRIQAVANSANKKQGERAILKAWASHLRESLTLPFDAEINEPQDRGPFQAGDGVKVVSFSELNDHYGLLVHVQHRRGNYVLPLCDLEAADPTSPNYQPLDDYVVWFANR